MQKLLIMVLFAASIFLASCAAKSELAEKKAKLEKLKEQQSTLGDDITKLQADIVKLDPSSKEEKAKLVSITPVAAAAFTHFIDLQGKIDAVNISYVTPRGGPAQVKGLYIKKGDNVKKGQLILQLDDAVARQSLAAAKQGLVTVQTQLTLAKDLYKRQKNLWDQGIGTEVQVITDKSNVDNLESQLKATQENIKVSQEQLNYTSVYSDVSGVAEDVNIRVGELFTGTGQIKIVNTSDLKVTTQIPENYLGRVKVGSHITVTLPDIHKTINATVTVASKLIDANSRSFYIEAKIPSDKDFHPNQIALIKIQDYTTASAITAPVNTLQTDDKGKFVMVAVKENNKLITRKKAVQIGELYGDTVEIKSGLAVGDNIITDGFQSLYDGQLITTDAKM